MQGTPGAGQDAPMSARDALAVLETQRDRVNRSLQVDVVAMIAAWGVAWLAGFGLAYLASGRSPAVSWAAGRRRARA